MEKSEPSFVPEWLKSSGSVTAAVSTNHHQNASLSLLSDDHVTLKPTRNKSSANISAHDSGHSPVFNRTTSSYFRRSSTSNGSATLKSYSSFGGTNRDRSWDKDTNEYRDSDKLRLGNHRHRNYSDPLRTNFSNRFEKDGLKRTQSSISGKHNEPWSRKVSADLNSSSKSNYNNGSTLSADSGGISTVGKAAFDRNFPSLGADERQTDNEIKRIVSPGLGTNLQSLPIGYSALTGEVRWTSALAEVPMKVGGNDNSASVAHAAFPTKATTVSSVSTGLNMAETLAQVSPRIQATTQSFVGTQRHEEMAIKQSRQLIPVTPSTPKTLVSNSSDKFKAKVFQQQHQTSSTVLSSSSPRKTLVRSDMPKTSSLGKLQVLKPARERNGVTNAVKDSLIHTNDSEVSNNPLTTDTSPPPLRSPVKNPIISSVAHKPAAIMAPTATEKNSSAQVRSRNDFFDLMRKKSLTNSSSSASDSISTMSQSVLEQPSETEVSSPLPKGKDTLLTNQSDMVHLSDNMNAMTSNRDACDVPQKSCDNGETHSSSDVILCSEEETAFLRSLGWDENAGEDEGLTEEEISEFYREASKYLKPGSSLKTSL